MRYAFAARLLSCIAPVVALLVFSASAAAQTGVVDAFTRADAGSLGVADSGQTWVTHAGAIAIQGGAAALPHGFALASIDAGASALDVAVTVLEPGSEFWLVLRLQDGANYWRFGRWSGGPYVLQQIENNALGAPDVLDGATVMPAAGDRLACQVRPVGIDCRVNGTMVAASSSSAGATATRVGLSGYQAGTTRLDDLTAVPPSAPDLSISLSGPDSLDFGTEGVWAATIRNVGASATSPGVLVVSPPPAAANVTVQGGTCHADGAGWQCTVGALAPGQEAGVAVHASAPYLLTELVISVRVEDVAGEDNLANNEAAFVTATREPLPPGTRLFDTFSRPDGPAGFADTGQPWIDHAGPFGIVGGAAATGAGFVLSSIDAGGGSGVLSARVVAPSPEFWTVLRFSDPANYWRFGRWQNEPYQLQRIMGNYATVVPSLASVSPAVGDTVQCLYWLDQLECGVNGVMVARATDAFNESAPRVGFSSYQAPGSSFDDLLVTEPPPVTDVAVAISGPVSIRAGEPGTWFIAYRNRGTSPLSGGELVIGPPDGLFNLSVSGASCSPIGDQYACVVPALPSGGTATISVSGVAPAILGSLSLSASSPVLAGEVDPDNNVDDFSTSVRPAIPANALVVDLFDRGNSATLGAADTGHPWTTHAGTPGTVGDEASLGSGFVLATLDSGVANADVSVTLTSVAQEFWLVFRLSDSQNYWRFGRWEGGAYQLQQIRGNELGVPAVQVLATVQPDAGDQITCRTGAFLIECAVNNVAVVRTGDTFNRTATRIGLSAYQAAAARFDDLVVVHQPAGPDLSVTVLAPAVALVDQHQQVTVRVRNNGDSYAAAAVVTVGLPAAATLIEAPFACSISNHQVSCPLASSLAPSGLEDFALTLMGSSAAELSGSAEAPLAGDVFPSDNSAVWTTDVETANSGIFDGFSRPDTASGLGSTLTGQLWQSLAGTFRIDAGEARALSAGSKAIIDPGVPYGTLEVVLGESANQAAILFRVVDAENYFRVAADLDGNYQITKVVGGVVQDLQFYILRHSTPVQPGDLVRIVTRPDDGVFVAVNGRHIIDAGDQQFMHATAWGLGAISGTPSFRSFAWRPVLEGFAAHDGFDGFDGTPLRSPTSGVSYHWLNWAGPPMIYDSGRARLQQDDLYSFSTLDTSSERASVRTTFVQPGTGAWIVFRYVEIGETYYRFGHENGVYTVTYMQGVMEQPLPVAVQQLVTVAPAPGDLVEVRQFADGTVECAVNGVVTHRFTDVVNGFRSTLTGLAGQDTTVRFDDFFVTPLP